MVPPYSGDTYYMTMNTTSRHAQPMICSKVQFSGRDYAVYEPANTPKAKMFSIVY